MHKAGDHPRLRGEQVLLSALFVPIVGSPPLARGTAGRRIQNARRLGITPACAGNRSPIHNANQNLRDHPRLRGEQKEMKEYRELTIGSPPLARGTGFWYSSCALRYRITPACAGNRQGQRHRVRHGRDHPRLRGEQTKKRLVVPCILQYCFSFFNQFFVDMFC